MLDLILAAAANEVPLLTMLYWACGVVGVGLVLVSALGGSHSGTDVHADVDAGVGADFDAASGADVGGGDVHADAGVHHDVSSASEVSSLAKWFSIRSVVFCLAVFGVAGVVLTYTTQIGAWTVLVVSVGGGLIAGQAVHQVFRGISRSSGDSTLQTGDFLNQLGRVNVPIEQGKMGEIVMTVRGAQRYVPARAKRRDAAFKAGDEVAVIEYGGDVAKVVSREEFEFLRSPS